jgi:hypothetical protein
MSNSRSNDVAPEREHMSRNASWQNPPIKKLVFVTNGIFPVTDRQEMDS